MYNVSGEIMENTNKTKKPQPKKIKNVTQKINDNKNLRLLVLVFAIFIFLIILAMLIPGKYLDSDFEIANIDRYELEKVEENMTYKDILKSFGKTKDVGEDDEHIAIYKVDDKDYLYLKFNDYNTKANQNRTSLEEAIVEVNMDDLGKLYLEIRTEETSHKIAIIEDYESLRKVLNIFDEAIQNGEKASILVSPSHYLKSTFNILGVGIVYLEDYKLWLEANPNKAAIKKDDSKIYYINEDDTLILKELLGGYYE